MKINNQIHDATITIRLYEHLKSEIKRQAEELGLTTSTLIRILLEQYFK